MPTAREYLDEQAALAQAGERLAMNAVAVGISPWTRGQARRLAAKFSPVEADDAFSEAMLVLPSAVRCWRPDRGGFLNYFAAVASRAICRWARREQQRHFPPLDLELCEPSTGMHRREPDLPPKLVALLSDMPASVRAAFVRRHGIDGHERMAITGIAADLGSTPASVRRLLTIAATVARWHALESCGTSAPARVNRPPAVRKKTAAEKTLADWFSLPTSAEKSNRVIARALGLDERTVRNYRHRHGIPSLPPHVPACGLSAPRRGTAIEGGHDPMPTGADYPHNAESHSLA